MTRDWIFQINTFESNTRGSSKKMYLLASDHQSKLESQNSDPDIALMFGDFTPVYTAFYTARKAWMIASGSYKGKTQGFTEMLENMQTKRLARWEGKIFAEFPEGSDTATEIFPRARRPYYEGIYDDQVLAFEALADKLTEYPVLAATQAEVQGEAANLRALRNAQQNKEGAVDAFSTAMEQNRIIVADAIYGNLGKLMFKFRTQRERISDFFELQHLRDTGGNEPVLLEEDIDAFKILNVNPMIGEIDATPETVVRMKNTSEEPASLVFYTTNNAADGPGAGPQFTLAPGQSLQKTMAELGFGTYNFFNIYNNSSFPGSWEIIIEV